MVVPMVNVDDYLFFVFSDLTCHLEETGKGVFWFHLPPNSKEIGVATKKLFYQHVKNASVVLKPWYA